MSASSTHLPLCRGLQLLPEDQQVVLEEGEAGSAAVQALGNSLLK